MVASPRTIDGGELAKHIGFAVCCGVVCAVAVALLVLLTNFGFSLLHQAPWLLFLLPLFALASVGVYRLFKLPFDVTIASLTASVRDDKPQNWKSAPAIAIGTFLSILGGASVDRTGPSMIIGASLATALNRLFKLKAIHQRPADLERECAEDEADVYGHDMRELLDDDTAVGSSGKKEDAESSDVSRDKAAKDDRGRGMHTYAAACGVGACFSAIFFAPLAGTVFVLEATLFKRSVRRHGLTLLLAAFTAFGVNCLFGLGNRLPALVTVAYSWHSVGLALVVGIICALVGMVFVALLSWLQSWTLRRSRNFVIWVLCGSVAIVALVGLCGWESFEGPGLDLVAGAMAGHAGPWDFSVKALLTFLALGFWLKGGEITPTLVTGALLGFSCTFLIDAPHDLAAVLGMLALFSSVSRCPMATILLGCEVFGWAGLPLYALAIIVANALGHDMGLYGEGAMSAARRLWRTRHGRGRAAR